MYQLTLFEAFFITHLVMDWIFQWKWEAMNKSKNILALLFHCTIYAVGFIPAFLIFKINFIWLVLIFASHIILDNRKFEFWVLEKFKGFKKEEVSESLGAILLIGLDQTFHLVILAIIVIFS